MDSDRNHEIEVKKLHELVDCLQKENQQLKELLEQAGIDYSSCIEENDDTLSVSGQGKQDIFRSAIIFAIMVFVQKRIE